MIETNCVFCNEKLIKEDDRATEMFSCKNINCKISGGWYRYSLEYDDDILIYYSYTLDINNVYYRLSIDVEGNVSYISILKKNNDGVYYYCRTLKDFEYIVCENSLQSVENFVSKFLKLKAFF